MYSRLTSEARRLLGAAGRIAGVVRVGSRPGERAPGNDQVLVANWPVLEPALEDLARPGRIAGLRGQRGAGDVRGHAVVRHRAPRVIGRSRLREPYVARVAGEAAARAGPRHPVGAPDLP